MSNGQKSLKLCFGTNCHFLPGLDSASYEQQYQNLYKPLISSLYTTPELPFTVYMSGTLIDWMEHHHPEFFMILEEMVSRKQIDILGGGYYSPLFPLVPPADRVGQIELLTTVLRKYFGKRPRGAWLTASAWEPSLVSSLYTCGIEYVLLDKILLETSGFAGVNGLEPVTLEDSGKTITALPLDNRYRHLENLSPTLFLQQIEELTKSDEERVVTIFVEHTSLAALFNATQGTTNWFETLLGLLKAHETGIELSTTGRVLKNKSLYKRAYISSGMSPHDFNGVHDPDEIRLLARTSVKHFLVQSRNIMNLYAKMMYVHVLVNQLRGDKSRKKTAREELWRAQNSDVYLQLNGQEPACQRMLRILNYKNLLIAEKSTRLRGVFSPSIVTFDFDMDGLKEYLCQLESLNMYVHSCGGKIFEFDVFKVYRNYCDVSLPDTGLFIDHFIAAEDLPLINKGELDAVRSVFSDKLYQDVTVDPSRHEIHLKANGLYGAFQQPISLRKQFSFRNEGIQVQYILKNDSPLALSGIFLIELDFALSETKNKPSIMTVYSRDARLESNLTAGTFDDVSWIQMTDPESKVKFTIDANENPSISIHPLVNQTRECSESRNKLDGARVFVHWKIELGPNYEMEKMLFLKIDT